MAVTDHWRERGHHPDQLSALWKRLAPNSTDAGARLGAGCGKWKQ
ncbi:hypothetical protein RR11_3519 [Ruegeria sp. R11]|nr:hypothetical protein RR11_3519 [Ruegeria sp. R11]